MVCLLNALHFQPMFALSLLGMVGLVRLNAMVYYQPHLEHSDRHQLEAMPWLIDMPEIGKLDNDQPMQPLYSMPNGELYVLIE